MSSRWQIVDDQLLLQRSDTPQSFKHSVRVDNAMLSFRYWDYLAWAVQRQQVKNILLLGLGGATVLQLLQRWGVVPTCLAVEIDAEMTHTIRKLGWLDYSNLTIVHKDARHFIAKGDENRKFDAVIVDLYDEYGFVQEVYRPPLLRSLTNLLSEQGILLLHCLDPAIKYSVLNLILPTNVPSTSLTVAIDLEALSMEVEIYPLWSSALVLARGKKEDIHFNDKTKQQHTNKTSIELRWLSKFLTVRRQTVQAMSDQCAYLHDDYTYQTLERLDANFMLAVVLSTPLEMRETLQKALGIKGKTSSGSLGIVWERHVDEVKPLMASTVKGFLAFMKLLEMKPSQGPEVEQIINAISNVAESTPSNPAFRHMESFALAWGGHWDKAVNLLD